MRGQQTASSPGPVTIVVVVSQSGSWYAWLGLRLLSRTEVAVRTGVAFWVKFAAAVLGRQGSARPPYDQTPASFGYPSSR